MEKYAQNNEAAKKFFSSLIAYELPMPLFEQ